MSFKILDNGDSIYSSDLYITDINQYLVWPLLPTVYIPSLSQYSIFRSTLLRLLPLKL